MNRYSPYFLFFVIFLISLHANAQWYNPDKVSKKVQDLNEKAYDAAVNNQYDRSIQLLQEALKLDPRFVDGHLSLGGVYSSIKNYTAAVQSFETGFALDSVYANTFLLPYSIALGGNGEFDKALHAVNRFLQTPKLNPQSIEAGHFRKKAFEFAIARQRDLNYKYNAINMGDGINTTDLEYYPSFTIDGSKMIFTRRIKQDEDFFESEYKNGQWTRAVPLQGKINTPFNEGAQSISQDGNWMIFAGCNYPDGEGSCDLYISFRSKSGEWMEAENLGYGINTEYWESSPSLSPDKRDLYFASNRPGGFGGRDIYVSHRGENGKWSKPVNLGEKINTKGDDGSPFIHADNQSLYFTSNGLPGYGMSDLYVTKKQPDNSWSAPQNLGYPINTIDDEGSLIVAADGKTGYFASDGKNNKGGIDIYSFELKQDIRAAKTLWVKGRVYDKVSGQGLPSMVELTNLGNKQINSKLQTDEDGNYLVTLPVDNDYAFYVNRKGYLFFSENFSMKEHPVDSAFVLDIPLQPISSGATVVLRNIFFDTKESALKPESITELEKVVQLLKENPKLIIEITGHTDNVGQPKDNLDLSSKRALAVVTYLKGEQIPAAQLKWKGFGETKPIAENNTDAGRAKNRRTELKVISN